MQINPEDLLVEDDVTIRGAHHGTVTVVNNGHVKIVGTINGALDLRSGGRATVLSSGAVNGSVSVYDYSKLSIHGDVSGAIWVDEEGAVVIETDGRQFGAIENHGSFENYGMRGGPVDDEPVTDYPSAIVVQPIVSGDSHTYNVPPRR